MPQINHQRDACSTHFNEHLSFTAHWVRGDRHSLIFRRQERQAVLDPAPRWQPGGVVVSLMAERFLDPEISGSEMDTWLPSPYIQQLLCQLIICYPNCYLSLFSFTWPCVLIPVSVLLPDRNVKSESRDSSIPTLLWMSRMIPGQWLAHRIFFLKNCWMNVDWFVSLLN